MSETPSQKSNQSHAQDAASNGEPVVPCRRGESMYPPACPEQQKPPQERPKPEPNHRYDLEGAQVEPEAGWWGIPRMEGELPRVVRIDEIRQLVEEENSEFFVPPYPRNRDFLEWEIRELQFLAGNRDNPEAITGRFEEKPPANDLPQALQEAFTDTTRCPLSDFIQIDPPPFGAIFNIGSRPQFAIDSINQQHLRRPRNGAGPLPPVVITGRQLARMFEAETPGLVHRNALNYLLFNRPEISPPRQTRIWMALDVAIYSALNAAWYYKWADEGGRSYRQRPSEYDRDRLYRVLFDDMVDDCGEFNECGRRMPCPSPGTPRHPAYPSGHSTFSAAASRVLAYFFPNEAEQFMLLANNIGTARLWGGVHWRTDHVAGQRIGFAVADLVIRQLQADCISSLQQNDGQPKKVPPQEELSQRARARRNGVDCEEKHDQVPTQSAEPFPGCDAERQFQLF